MRKVWFLSWAPGQRKDRSLLAKEEVELSQREGAAINAAHALVKEIDADLAQKDSAEFLNHLLQNALMRENSMEDALKHRAWEAVREDMQALDKYVRLLNIIVHKMLGEERKRQAFLNALLVQIERITKLQIQADKKLSEEG